MVRQFSQCRPKPVVLQATRLEHQFRLGEDIAIGRSGSSIRYAGAEVFTHEVGLEGDMEPYSHYRKHRRYRATHALRQEETVDYNTGRALACARSLAELCGYSVSIGTPITWSDDRATVWLPPDDGSVDINFLGKGIMYALD